MSLRMTEEEYAELMRRRNAQAQAGVVRKDDKHTFVSIKPERKSKYGNERVEVSGRKFDSRHEARVWEIMELRVKAGELAYVLRQVPFELPGGIRYFADFVAVAPDGRIEGVYDAKSEITRKNRVYINKRKQIKEIYGIEIKEV